MALENYNKVGCIRKKHRVRFIIFKRVSSRLHNYDSLFSFASQKDFGRERERGRRGTREINHCCVSVPYIHIIVSFADTRSSPPQQRLFKDNEGYTGSFIDQLISWLCNRVTHEDVLTHFATHVTKSVYEMSAHFRRSQYRITRFDDDESERAQKSWKQGIRTFRASQSMTTQLRFVDLISGLWRNYG